MDSLIFRYIPRSSILHRFDPRLKLPLFALLCFCLLTVAGSGLILLAAVLFFAYPVSRISFRTLLSDFLRFTPILILFFLVLYAGEYSRGRLLPAVIRTGRFALLILTGNLFIHTTRTSDVGTAIRSLCSPLPFLRGGKIATMLSLSLSMIPFFFRELQITHEALRSRGLSLGRRPIRWAKNLIQPLMIRIFLNAEETAEAMEARCYRDDRSSAPLRLSRTDWITAALCLVVMGSSLLF